MLTDASSSSIVMYLGSAYSNVWIQQSPMRYGGFCCEYIVIATYTARIYFEQLSDEGVANDDWCFN